MGSCRESSSIRDWTLGLLGKTWVLLWRYLRLAAKGGLLFVDFTLVCCQPNVVIKLLTAFIPINHCHLPLGHPQFLVNYCHKVTIDKPKSDLPRHFFQESVLALNLALVDMPWIFTTNTNILIPFWIYLHKGLVHAPKKNQTPEISA